jgi:hypothetical protein
MNDFSTNFGIGKIPRHHSASRLVLNEYYNVAFSRVYRIAPISN